MRNHNSKGTVLWLCYHAEGAFTIQAFSITYYVVWTDVPLTSSKISVWTESKDSCDPRRAALSRALRPLEKKREKCWNCISHWNIAESYFISELDSFGRRVFLRRFISSGCLLLLLRIAQSSSVSAASYLPWRRYKAPRFFNFVWDIH